jgi:hypothetical protein
MINTFLADRYNNPVIEMIRRLFRKLINTKSGSLPAHAHRHERHDEIVVGQMN